MSSSSSHTSPFSHRPGARIPSNSSSGSSSWHDHNRWSTNPDDMEHSFTSDMRDRQARGKDPYADDDSSENGVRDMGVHGMGMRLSGGGGNVASRLPKEPFQKTERRDWAETVLDNPELLMMYAQSSGDTLPATRLKFKKIMCGLEEDEETDVAISDVSRGQYQHHQNQQQRFSSSAQQRSGRGGAGASGSRNER